MEVITSTNDNEEKRQAKEMIVDYKTQKGITPIDHNQFWEVRQGKNGSKLVKELANRRIQRQNFLI